MVDTSVSEAKRIIMDCDTAIRAKQADIERAYEIWDAYFAIQGSSWDKRKRDMLREQDRHPWHFDVLGTKVETLAGSLVADLPDMDWQPVNMGRMQTIEAVREKYYLDKELFNYHDEALLFTIRDGCVHSGWCQLKESTRFTNTGNIALERCRPGYVIPDPFWVTDSDRDLEVLYKIGYYLPEKMMEIWAKKSDIIDAAVKKRHDSGNRYGTDMKTESRDDQQRQFKSEVADQFRVIEKFYTKENRAERLLGRKYDNGQLSTIPFPVTKDRAFLQQFAEANNIGWDDVSVSEYREKRQYIKTVTDLDGEIFLEDGETREQVNGLSFFHYTCQRFSGHDKGIAEAILDTQRVIDEKESYLLEYMAKAGGGSEVWNEDLFKNEDKKKSFMKNKNKFGHTEFADLDNVKTPRLDVPPAQVPSAVFEEIRRMYEITVPMVSRVSDAMSAISGSEDSGVLFERKYQMNRIANILYDKYVKLLINNIGEAYYYQFQITYGDVEQEVKTRIGGSITINQKDAATGRITNDVSSLPRAQLIVTESKANPIYQLRKKAEVAEIIRSIPPNDELRLQEVLNMYMENMTLSDEQTAEIEMINELKLQSAIMGEYAKMAGYDATIKQNQVMSLQMQAQLQGAAPGAQPQPQVSNAVKMPQPPQAPTQAQPARQQQNQPRPPQPQRQPVVGMQ